MAKTQFKGGLSAARSFYDILVAAGFPAPNRLDIVPQNIEEMDSPHPFDEPVGRGTPGNDTRDSNVWVWLPKITDGAVRGSCYLNVADLQRAFELGGIDGAKALYDAAPLIPPNSSDSDSE